MIESPGVKTQPSVPTKNTTAIRVRVFLRPRLSLSTPETSAPTAAPMSSVAVTRPSVTVVRPRSFFMGSRAPLITPVS